MKILTFDLVDNNECFITGTVANNKYIYLATYSVKTGELLYDYSEGNSIRYYGIISVAVAWCNNDRFSVICNGTKYVHFQNLVQPHIKSS